MATPASTASQSAPMADSLPSHVTVVFVGHHQSGKSTTAGHLIMKLGGLDKRALERVERETSSRPTSRYAWILDRLRPERERAMTVDLKLCRVHVPPALAAAATSTTSSSTATATPATTTPSPATSTAGSGSAGSSAPPGAAAGGGSGGGSGGGGVVLTLLDTPGHPDYLRNTIAAITQADVAVLLVDSRPAVLEQPVWPAQTRDLALLAANLANHRALVVAINQLDAAYDAAEGGGRGEQRYSDATAAITRLLKRREGITFVPISGYTGDNLTEPSPRMTWWSGPSLLGAMLAAGAAAAAAAGGGGGFGTAAAANGAVAAAGAPRVVDMPLRMPVIHVYKVGGIGTVPAGRIAAGRLTRGTSVLLQPPGITAQVRSIESFHEGIASGGAAVAAGALTSSQPGGGGGGVSTAATAAAAVAGPGDFVGLSIKGVASWQLRRGCVVSDATDRPARLAAAFTAKVQILRDPTSKRAGRPRTLRPGYCMLVHVHAAQVPCRLDSIRRLANKADTVGEVAPCLREGDLAVVQLRPLRPLVVEPYDLVPHMGRFAVRAAMRSEAWGAGVMVPVIVAVGRVEAVQYAGEGGGSPEAPSQTAENTAKATSKQTTSTKAAARAAAVGTVGVAETSNAAGAPEPVAPAEPAAAAAAAGPAAAAVEEGRSEKEGRGAGLEKERLPSREQSTGDSADADVIDMTGDDTTGNGAVGATDEQGWSHGLVL